MLTIAHAGENWDAPRLSSASATSRNCSSPRCATRCAIWDINPPCTIWKLCASSCYARPACCRTQPGLLSAEWIARLAAVSPSMGLMLESVNSALLAPGAAHDNAPDKVPAKRLRTIEEAGKQRVPFTTGLLIGIGETLEDRVDTLLAIRDLHDCYGHIQEVLSRTFAPSPRSRWLIPRAQSRRDAPHRGGSSLANAQGQYSGASQPQCAVL